MFLSNSFGAAIWNAVSAITGALGIDPILVYGGYQLFHFWR
jgi:hypothetical protein